MTKIFLNLANLSITAGYLILAVLILRLILRRLPKNLLLWLWGLVGLRLILPFSLESALSLIPRAKPIPMDIAYSPSPAIDSGVAVIDRAVNPVMAESLTPAAWASVNPLQIVLAIASIIWLAGVAVMLLYAAFSYCRLSRKCAVSLPLGDNRYLCDGIRTPFVLGIINPKIYLPSDMNPENQSYVLEHEAAHLRHRDHWWKPLGFLLLSVYWFHPLVWIAYYLFCRDLEMACDERAIAGMGEGERKAYSYALLSCAAHGRVMAACPLAFGENSVKSRIKNVLHFKKAGSWVSAAVVVITVIAAVCFLTNPKEEEKTLLQTVPDTVPTEAMEAAEEDYQPISGYYAYTNGGLTLEIDKVSGVKTQTARDSSGEVYEQTILLTEPGTVVSIVDPDMNGEAENWRLRETTGSLAPIPIRDDLGSRHLALGHNDYYLEDVNSNSHRVLLLQRKVEDITFYQPATAADADAYDLNAGKLLFSYQRFMKTPPGDLGKLALALVVLEGHDPQELVDTTNLPAYLSEPIYRQSFSLVNPGMQLERMGEMTVEDLLTVMLLRGADDATYALARFAAGSEEEMVAKMNEYVKYACMDTNYTDLYGYAEGQYTTGMDTIFLVNRMLQNPCLSKIWQAREYTAIFPDNGEEYTGYTSNYLFDNCTIPEFYDVRVTGGFAYYRGTASAVCTARKDGKDVLFVILGAQRRFAENGWQVKYYGNYEEMGSLINTVFEAMDSYPVQFAD
ncbi:MAG: hypothetical protein MR913_12915 [Clostridiales bacterium]|nr:hypothetical protein [Clostridiales bacterium]